MAWRWEIRGNNEYLYAAHRVNGRVVRRYLARNGRVRQTMNVLMLDRQERDRREHETKRQASVELRTRIGGTMRELAKADAGLRLAVEGVLAVVGYRKHERGCWRMKRKPNKANTTAETADTPMVPYHSTPPSATDPLIHYHPLKNWIDGADDLFACARAGDEEAQSFLRQELRENKHAREHFGDLGMRSTKTLVARVTGGDAPWCIAVEEQVRVMTKELLGETPTVLDQLIVRRIVNAWVTVHALELELAIRPPARARDRAYLEAAAERASRRMTQAVTELARVRRLQLPAILVNVTPPSPPPPPVPRIAKAEVLETKRKAESVEGAADRHRPTSEAKQGKGAKGSRRKAA